MLGKKALVFFITYAVTAKVVSACPIEGPNMPNGGRWKTGLQVNIMFDKEMRNIKGEVDTAQLFSALSYGITERLCFDGKAGIGEIKFDIEDSEKIEYPAGFAGGYGGRILLHDDKKSGIRCILGLHHISVHPDSVEIGGVEHKAILDEWQCSLMISKTINRFSPYIAGKFSKIYLIRWVDGFRERITPESDWGLVAGTDFKINENARLSLEGRAFDEESVTIGFGYTF